MDAPGGETELEGGGSRNTTVRFSFRTNRIRFDFGRPPVNDWTINAGTHIVDIFSCGRAVNNAMRASVRGGSMRLGEEEGESDQMSVFLSLNPVLIYLGARNPNPSGCWLKGNSDVR